jgi:hypothetical protein
VLSVQVDARCTAEGIEVVAVHDVDREVAAVMLERLQNWRMIEAKRARWERQGWKRTGPSPELPWSTRTVTSSDDGDVEGPGFRNPPGEASDTATAFELVAAVVEFLDRRAERRS